MSGPTDPENSVSSISPSRRSVLRALGVGAGVSMLGGVGAAKPGDRGRGDPKKACGECATGFSYEKIDGAPEEGDEYTLATGVTITITDVDTNDDGEVVGIKFDADGFVDKLCIKGGPATEVYTGITPDQFDDEWFYAPDNPNSGKKYEISNVAYCSAKGVRYQADLVAGYPLCDLDPDASPPVTYTGQNRRLASWFANFPIDAPAATQHDVTGSVPSYVDAADCFTQTDEVGEYHTLQPTETGFEATWVNRDLSCGPDPFYVTIVVYRIPEGVADDDFENQVLVGAKMVEAETEDGTLSFEFDTDAGDTVDCVRQVSGSA